MRQGVITAHDVLQSKVTNELILDKFCCKQLGNTEDFVAGNTDEEGDGVEDISEDKLESKLVEAETSTDPGQETVNHSNKGDDSQDIGTR